MNIGSFFQIGSVLSAIALLLIVGASDSGFAGGKGGGGKPPPPQTAPANPVIVFRAGSDIAVADADGGNQTVVLNNLAVSLNAASWCSPEDGTDIVFVDEINGTTGVYRLQVAEVDNLGTRTLQVGEPILVTTTNDIGLTRPACSPVPVGPDQKIMVVFRDREIEPDGSLSEYDNFYLTNLDGSGAPILLLDGLQRGGLAQFNPSWSPLGDRIVFSSVQSNSSTAPYDVEVVEFHWDTSTGELIVHSPQSLVRGVIGSQLQLRDTFLRPSWSNSGDRIVVDADSADPETNAHEIWIIPMDNPANASQVIYGQNSDVIRADVAWSPDDNQLIYLRNPRRGMCGEGDSRKVKGSAIAISNIGGASDPIDKDGFSCDEIAIIQNGRFPDWWRGAGQ